MRLGGKVQVQVQPQLQLLGECLERPNLQLEACLEQQPALRVPLGKARLTSLSLEQVVLVLLPRPLLLQHLEVSAHKQVKRVDSSEPNQQPLEHLQQPLQPQLLASAPPQPKQAACLANQQSPSEQLRQPSVQLRQQPGLGQPQPAQLLEASVPRLHSRQRLSASLGASLLNPRLALAHLLQLRLLGLVEVLELHLLQVNYRYYRILL